MNVFSNYENTSFLFFLVGGEGGGGKEGIGEDFIDNAFVISVGWGMRLLSFIISEQGLADCELC